MIRIGLRYTMGCRLFSLIVTGLVLVTVFSASVVKARPNTYECLTTPNGIPRKVMVKKENVKAYERREFHGLLAKTGVQV
jgi:hypothetical protein